MSKKYYYMEFFESLKEVEHQMELFLEDGAKKREIFREKKPNTKDTWEKIIGKAEPKDIIVIRNFSILGKDRKEVIEKIIEFYKKDIIIKSIEQPYLRSYIDEKFEESENLQGDGIYSFLNTALEVDSLRAEWEYKRFRKKIIEGRKNAREHGVVFGRKYNGEIRVEFKKLYPFTKLDRKHKKYRSIRSVTEQLKCSRAQFYIMERELKKESSVVN